MPRLIDADKLMEAIKAHHYPLVVKGLNSTDYGMFTLGIQQVVDEQPTVDAEPKHAYVIIDEDGNMECSNCGSSFCFDSYCGHCGAKLMGERKKEVEVVDSMPTMWVMDEESHRCLTFPEEKGTSVRHGHWVNHISEDGATDGTYCSICDYEVDRDARYNYCPNCGAEMDKVE